VPPAPGCEALHTCKYCLRSAQFAPVRSNPGLFRRPNGAAKTASEAVAALERHFDGEMARIKNAVTRLSAAEPAIVPVDDGVA
jgi:hypothetical protein